MARLRLIPCPPKLLAKAGKVTHVLTFEEKTRFAHFFNLLVEIDVRLPKTTKTKTEKCEVQGKHRPVEKRLCCIKCPATCNLPRPAWRDLFLNSFIRILNINKINTFMRYKNDRHHCFIAYT